MSDALAVVSDLWRYPVKSFGGERLRRVFVGPFGLLGDRRYAVLDTDGPLTARRAHDLLRFRARYDDVESADRAVVETPTGQLLAPLDPALDSALEAQLGYPVGVQTWAPGFFDVAPVHLLGEASLATLGTWVGDDLDRRRFRANVIVDAGSEPFAEDAWIGRRLAIGGAVVEVVVNTERCAVTTFDPDTLARDGEVLAALARERDNLFGIYGRVVRPGWVGVGDEVRPHPDGS